ncbi:hypothetical protein V1478_008678 [Vespula squamosa]|uniref:Uncharacterized protein n=1 Tax=Vespula squamosa TaxID=30214 RepID=A0ABD2AW69_VESSQ
MEQFEPIREWPELLNTQPLPQTLLFLKKKKNKRKKNKEHKTFAFRKKVEGKLRDFIGDTRSRKDHGYSMSWIFEHV